MLAGPVQALSSMWLRWQTPQQTAAAFALAGLALLLAGRIHGEVLPPRAWLAVAALALPGFVVALAKGWVVGRGYDTPWAVGFLITLAAPLWLGVLSAADAVAAETPRATVAAGIAGVGAALLVIPAGAYTPALTQLPILLLQIAAGVAVVYTWSLGQRMLAGQPSLLCAGSYLLLLAVLSLVQHPSGAPGVGWREDAWLILLQAALWAATFGLWFFLLLRLKLPAFAMLPLAAWTANVVCGLPVTLFASWRVDLAAAVALAAVLAGLRAHPAEEQPATLGLGDT